MYQVFSLIFGVPLAAFWGLIFGMCFYPNPPTHKTYARWPSPTLNNDFFEVYKWTSQYSSFKNAFHVRLRAWSWPSLKSRSIFLENGWNSNKKIIKYSIKSFEVSKSDGNWPFIHFATLYYWWSVVTFEIISQIKKYFLATI